MMLVIDGEVQWMAPPSSSGPLPIGLSPGLLDLLPAAAYICDLEGRTSALCVQLRAAD